LRAIYARKKRRRKRFIGSAVRACERDGTRIVVSGLALPLARRQYGSLVRISVSVVLSVGVARWEGQRGKLGKERPYLFREKSNRF
jgi:hypothetical protein